MSDQRHPGGLSAKEAAKRLRKLGPVEDRTSRSVASIVAGNVFTLFNAILLGTLPYPDSDRLVLLWEGDRDTPSQSTIVAAPVYEDWRRMNRSLESIAIWEHLTFNVAASDEPEQVIGIRASPSLFDVLGVPPALGRGFRPEEDAPGHAVAVISDAVWQSQFQRSAPRVSEAALPAPPSA